MKTIMPKFKVVWYEKLPTGELKCKSKTFGKYAEAFAEDFYNKLPSNTVMKLLRDIHPVN